jgi:hypothetical protein
MLDKQTRALTGDAMTVFASVLYICASEYVVGGLLPRTFNINERHSRCVADRLMRQTTLIPEVARLMFRQGASKRSPALRRLIADCTTRRTTPPST